jgi:cyanophycinase
MSQDGRSGSTQPSIGPDGGPVMVIGGAEDKLKDKVILSRFVDLAGETGGHIVVVSTASSLGDAATELYRSLFQQMGAGPVSGLRPLTRESANEEVAARLLDDATGVFLTGGNQLRLASVVGGTKLGRAIAEAHIRGAVVAGTSAGASALATHMMAFGQSGAIPKHRMAQMSAGLGILTDVVIDQHFEQRTRLGRLIAVVAQSPSLLGVGVDEDTAALFHPDHVLEVLGRGVVTIVDGIGMVTDAFQTKGYRPMMVSGAVLHSLPSGYRFDIDKRALLPPLEVVKGRRVARAETAERRMRRLAKDIAVEGADSFVIDRRRSRSHEEEASE